jgi:hypothetical protein
MILKHNTINYLSVREQRHPESYALAKSMEKPLKRDERSEMRNKQDEKHERRVRNDPKLQQTRNDSESETRDETCQGHGTF